MHRTIFFLLLNVSLFAGEVEIVSDALGQALGKQFEELDEETIAALRKKQDELLSEESYLQFDTEVVQILPQIPAELR